jgi:hypothetical protein
MLTPSSSTAISTIAHFARPARPAHRDIRHRIAGDEQLEEMFARPLSRADQIRSQLQRQRGWKCTPSTRRRVEFIGKGKASAPYEFAFKDSIVTTNRRVPSDQFVLHAEAASRQSVRWSYPARHRRSHGEPHWPRNRARYVDKRYRGHAVDTPSDLHLRAKAWGVQRHQARAQASLRNRLRDRPYEGRESSAAATTKVGRQCFCALFFSS